MVAVTAVVTAALIPSSALAAGSGGSTTRQLRAASSGSAVQPSTSAAVKFSSPASASHHTVLARGSARAATALPRTTSGSTIYAQTAGNCGTETGNGSLAAPFCRLQNAVNAAESGDTIVVFGGGPTDYPLTITKSDLTIVGEQVSGLIPEISGVDGPMLTLDGVHNVSISNFQVLGTVAIEGSTNVTLDSDYAEGILNSTGSQDAPAVSIDGSSGSVEISRTMLVAPMLQSEDGIIIASGASDITLAGDAFIAGDVAATGVNGLTIVDSTFQRGCFGAVNIAGSAYVSIENNVFEDANATTDAAPRGYPASCFNWLRSDVTITGTAGTTTADYNDFSLPAADQSYPYNWFGSVYTTVSAFQTATGMGTHDTTDTTSFGTANVDSGSNNSGLIDLIPPADSPAVGSANPSAPGQLSSDFFGVSPYTTRGAMQYVSGNPDLAVALAGEQDLALGVTAGYTITTEPRRTLTVSFDWGDGTAAQNVTVASSELATVTASLNHEYAQVGRYKVTVTVSDDARGDQAVNTMTVQTAGSEYTPYGPARILDTRNGIGAAAAPVAPGHTLQLKVDGAGSASSPIPSDVTAVVMNVTAVSPTANGFLTVYGDEDQTGATVTRPSTSNLNFATSVNVPNLVVVPVGADGVVDFYNGSPKGSVQVLADIAGYFTQSAASLYKSVTPARILDTRKGIGTGKAAMIPANGSITLTVAGAGSGAIPSTGSSAVALNLTAVDSTRNGLITAYPAGQSLPTVSNVNYLAGQTIANMAMVPLGTHGQIVLHNNSSGPVDLIADAFGYFSTVTVAGASAYLPAPTPHRILDTRGPGGSPVTAGTLGYLQLTSLSAVTAAVFNATVTQTTGNGLLALYPYQPDNPLAVPATSNLNYRTNQTVPNLAIVPPGTVADSDGYYDLGVYLGGKGSAEVILDYFGIFADQ